MALIDLPRAKEAIPNFPDDDDAVLQDIINACDALIKRRLGRDIESTTYDEYYSGNGYSTMRLRQYPIISIAGIRWNFYPLLQVRYTDTTVAAATINVTSTGLVLTSIKNATTTTTTLLFATYTTVGALINAINAVSNWQAVGNSTYNVWATSEIKPQGVYDALWNVAQVKCHIFYQGGFTIMPDSQEVFLPAGWIRGINNYRVQYTAGYASVPEALQQACAELAAAVYLERTINPNLQSESLGGYSYSNMAEKSFKQLSAAAREAIQLYTDYSIQRYIG